MFLLFRGPGLMRSIRRGRLDLGRCVAWSSSRPSDLLKVLAGQAVPFILRPL